ncbi:MAG: hypothetical protein AAB338_01795 [Patescibacteria group bacterium]
MNKFLEIAQITIPIPQVSGQGLTLAEIGTLIARVGSFLTSVGVLFAIIAVIVSGIMYMRAGAEPTKITSAQSWFKNALLGALIVLGVGVIINTIANIVTREFFCRLIVLGRCFIP